MVFPVVMYGCERWTIKKAERQRIDAFEVWCWRRLLRVPWTARRSNQSILKEINPELTFHWKDWCWSWSSNTLALWCKEPTHWKRSDAGKDWRQKEKRVVEGEAVGWHHWLNGYEFEQTPGDSRTGKPGMPQSMGFQRVRCDLATEQHKEKHSTYRVQYYPWFQPSIGGLGTYPWG